jgi:hypothetical protein
MGHMTESKQKMAAAPFADGDTLWHTIRYPDSAASPAHWQGAFDPVTWRPGADNTPLQMVSCAGVGDQLQLVALGSDRRLWHNLLLAGGWDQNSWSIESQEQNDPGTFNWVSCGGVDGELQVVGVDWPKGQLWHTIRHADGSWQPFFGLIEDNEINNPGYFGFVSCAGVGGDLHVVAISGGQPSQIWHTIRYSASGSSPAHWQRTFEPVTWPAGGELAQVSCADVAGTLQVVGLDAQGQLWRNVYVPGASPPWVPDPEPIQTIIQSNPGHFYAVGCAGANGELHVVGAAAQLWHTIRHADGTWQPFFGLIEDNESNNPGAFGAVGCAGVGGNLHVAACLILPQ